MAPGQHLCIGALLRIIAAVDNAASHTACATRSFHTIREAFEVLEKVRGGGGA
jgi:hypothetical protein